MSKIASTRDLQVELQALLTYAETPNPSRSKLASGLFELAEQVSGRTASVPSEVLAQARQLGVDAFLADMPAIPARDPALRELLKANAGESGGASAVLKILDAWTAGWHGANLEAPVPGVTGPDTEVVHDAIEKLLEAARKAKMAADSGNDKRMFFALLGVLDALGTIGRAHEVADVGFLQRVWKSFAKHSGGRPGSNF